MSDEYIRGDYMLRRLTPPEWPLLKTIRLEALATSPSVFGNSLALESTFPDSQWEERISSAGNAIWGLFYKEEIIGLTSVFGDTNVPGEARFTTSFIRPAHRGQGLATLFYQARIAWAKSAGLRRIWITHRIGNEPSRRANQRAGFKYTHTETRMWPDGQEAENLFYELWL